MKNGRKHAMRLLSALALVSGFFLSPAVQAACSAYAGKVVFNELFRPASAGSEFVELRVLDPSVVTASTNFAGWQIDLYAGSNALKQSVNVGSGFTNATVNSCGQTSLWLRFPSSALSFLQTYAPPYNLVLYDTTGGNKIIDILRAGTTATSYYGAGTTYGACSAIEGQLPATGTVDSQYDTIVSASGASDKDLFRDPDGTGPWMGASTSGTANSVCGSNNGGGTFGLTKVPSVTSVNANTNFSYVMHAINGATAVAAPASVVITDTLPAGISFVSCTASPGTTSGTSSGPTGTCTHSAGVVTWTVGAMAANKDYKVTLTVQGATGGAKVNSIVSNVPANAGFVSATATAVTVTAPAAPHHVRLNHGGSGVTCTGSAVTVNACDSADSAGVCTLNTLGLSGNVIAKSAGGATLATVPFTIAAGSSSTTVSVPVSTAQTATFETGALSVTPASAWTCWDGTAASCSHVYSDAGFFFNVPNHVAEVLQTVTVSAVKKSNNSLACTPAFANVAKNVTFACGYGNPASGTLPVRVAANALNAANSPAAACDAGGRAVSLAFNASGVATTTFQYADVGSMTLTANYTGTGADAGLVMTGSDTFIAAPQSFAFSGITAGPIKAGSNFSATLTAMNNAGAATPNFGKEAAAEGVTLSSVLVSPVGGANPALGGNVIAGTSFTSGVTTVNNLTWGEVGNITLNAALTSASYLGSGLNASGASATVGVFIPEHFDTAVVATATAPLPCPAGLTCPALYNGFVYSGQPFSVQAIARNLAGGVTTNYAGAFAKAVTLTAWDALGSTTMQNPGGGLFANNAVASSAFAAGVATTAIPTYTLATVLTAPADIYLRAKDTDNVTSLRTPSSASIEGGVKVVSGRIRISNAHGSELLPLPMTATVQYYNGTNWVTSATDNLTQFNSNLSSAGGNVVANIVSGLAGGVSVASPGVVTVLGGVKVFTLNKPGAAGGVDISLNAPIYLPSNKARATFGVYKGNNEFIYLRENY